MSSTSGSKASATEEDELKERYENFLVDFEISYSDPQEKRRRFEIFKKNVREIDHYNLTCQKGDGQRVHYYADMELEEAAPVPVSAGSSLYLTLLESMPIASSVNPALLNCNLPPASSKPVYKLKQSMKELYAFDPSVKFRKDSVPKDENNQVVTQQDSAPKDEESQDEQERANGAGLKIRKQRDEKESSLIDSKKPKLDEEEGKKPEMEIEGLKGKMVNSAVEEQIKKINDEPEATTKKLKMEMEGLKGVEEQIKKMFYELEAKMKSEIEATFRNVRQLLTK